MNGSDNEVKVGSGKDPKGVAVTFWEVDRPATMGARGSQGFIVEVKDASGKRITHSDSLAGLKGAGYKVDGEKTAPAPEAPVKEKSIEDELG